MTKKKPKLKPKKAPARTSKRRAKAPVRKKPTKQARPARRAKKMSWPQFVKEQGVVLASAKGPMPNVAEAIVGEPIVGSWWSHPKAQQIFDALSEIDDDADIRCFKLVDKKITFVHRRMWPALVKLAKAGVIARDRVESIQQEHMPTGEHRNFTTPFPDWVPDEVMTAADKLSIDSARALLGSWI